MYNFEPKEVLVEIARTEFDDFMIVAMDGAEVHIMTSLQEDEWLFHLQEIKERIHKAKSAASR